MIGGSGVSAKDVDWFQRNRGYLEHIERIGPLCEPFPLACEHYFVYIGQTTSMHHLPARCTNCGLVSHNVIAHPPGG
jgi:hypothetical protein